MAYKLSNNGIIPGNINDICILKVSATIIIDTNRINIDTQHIQLMNNEIVVIGIPVENLEMNRDNETMEAFVVNIN